MSTISENKKTDGRQLSIQKIYTKDLSFEAPNTPQVFQGEWKPELNLELNIETKKLNEEEYEVILRITLTAKKNNITLFIAEVNQAGIFLIKQFPPLELESVLGSFCPSVLFPYAREACAYLVNHGGFPPIHLAPINFDALYTAQQAQKNKDKEKMIVH